MRWFILLLSFVAFTSAPIISAQTATTGSNSSTTADPSPTDSLRIRTDVHDDQVWINIAVLRNGVGGSVVHFYGSIEKKVFTGLIETTVPTGFLELHNTSWFTDNGTFQHASDEKARNGDTYGNTDVFYFRAALITEMIILDESFVKQHFKGK